MRAWLPGCSATPLTGTVAVPPTTFAVPSDVAPSSTSTSPVAVAGLTDTAAFHPVP